MRELIDAAILGRTETLERLGEIYGISEPALRKHAKVHLAEAVESIGLRQAALRAIAPGATRKRYDAGVERIIEEMARLAMVDPGDLYDENGKPRKVQEIPEDARRAISGMDIGEDGTIKIRMHNKVEALGLLARARGMMVDRRDEAGVSIQIVLSDRQTSRMNAAIEIRKSLGSASFSPEIEDATAAEEAEEE